MTRARSPIVDARGSRQLRRPCCRSSARNPSKCALGHDPKLLREIAVAGLDVLENGARALPASAAVNSDSSRSVMPESAE